MDAVEGLILKYGLEDPVADETSCVFTYPDFIDMCASLIEHGKQSFEDEFNVGVIIETMDIDDLKIMLAETDKTDVGKVLSNLLEGSYNHLDKFEKHL